MIDLIIRLLIEKLMVKPEYYNNETKKRDLNEAVIILKDLKANLDEEYIDIKKFGKQKEE